MAQLTLFTQDDNDNEKAKARHVIFDTCKKWGFSLRTIEHGDDYLYSIIDWVNGMIGYSSKTWFSLKERIVKSTYFSFSTIQYEGKGKSTDFTDKNGIILITKSLRVRHNTPILTSVRYYIEHGEFPVDSNDLIDIKYREQRDFHPIVFDYLINNGFSDICHEVNVPMTGRADFTCNHPIYGMCVIECKVSIINYVLIMGQVISYAYSLKAKPFVAFPKHIELNEQHYQIANDFNVVILST